MTAALLALVVGSRFMSPRLELPPPTSGAPAPGAPQAGDAGTAAPRGIEGRVTALDRKAGTMRMRDKTGDTVTLTLSPQTTVFVDGRVGHTSDIKAGDVVRSVFDPERKSVSWIEVEKHAR